MQLNAPPPTVPLTNQAKLGQTVFKMINCIACHTPSMTTGANSIAALSFQPVPLYSDLLLHDMGTSAMALSKQPPERRSCGRTAVGTSSTFTVSA